jgi:hypothetical protein
MRGIDAKKGLRRLRLHKHTSTALGQVFAAIARGTTCDILGNPPNPSADPFITSCDCEYDKKPRMSPCVEAAVSAPTSVVPPLQEDGSLQGDGSLQEDGPLQEDGSLQEDGLVHSRGRSDSR